MPCFHIFSLFPPHPLLLSVPQEQPRAPMSPSLQPPQGAPAHPAECPPPTPTPSSHGLPSPHLWPHGSHSTALFPREQCVCVTTTMSFHLRLCPGALWDEAQRALCAAQGWELGPLSLGASYATCSLGCVEIQGLCCLALPLPLPLPHPPLPS